MTVDVASLYNKNLTRTREINRERQRGGSRRSREMFSANVSHVLVGYCGFNLSFFQICQL